ncbi:Tyrosine 3-monooxygenase [Acipenser ruthenus]|uniref:Tyrosine 3-monooxygenase n=1 Tax=Acipenser ruthenus TaxID=7906 RepID=A0A444UNE5_ACIRT|nr:Tyrosine 3-monooxygenase [Acipenser ruthenus]
MKSDVQSVQHYTSRRRSLIEDARKEKEAGSPTSTNTEDGLVFELENERVTLNIFFTLRNAKNAGLSKTGKVFETCESRIHHIETRPTKKSKNSVEDLEFFIRCEVHSSDINILINSLKRVADDVKTSREEKVPWFPKKIRDLDKCHHLITKYDPDLDHDHPYALSNEPEYKPFDPETTAVQPYQDQTYQPVYFVSESFEDAKTKLRQYSSKIKKAFSVRYDPFTCSIEVLDKPQKVKNALNQMRDELKNLCFALEKLS